MKFLKAAEAKDIEHQSHETAYLINKQEKAPQSTAAASFHRARKPKRSLNQKGRNSQSGFVLREDKFWDDGGLK